MKILFLHKWLIMGGIERILVNYLSILQDEKNLHIDILIDYDKENNVFHRLIPSGMNVDYLFNNHYCSYKENLYAERNKNWIKKIKYKFFNFKEKMVKRKSLLDYISKGKYDIIINFSNHFDSYIIFEELTCPVIRWQHLAIDNNIREKDIKILNKYHKVITICEDMKKQLIDFIPSDKIEVLFNPIEVNKVLKLSNESIPVEYEFSYLVQVARLDKIKRHSDLITIFSRLVNSGRKEKLLIIGGGPEFHNLKKLINDLSLQESCYLLGEIENPYPYIKNAKLFLHTSEREGLPTVLLESIILTTPVVAMDCPTGPREILDNGKCGELVEMGNNEEFIYKTLVLLEEQEKINYYKNNMNIHIKKFSEFEIKRKFLSLIYQMTGINNEKI
ncbi:glycosyltransferase [Mannheimia granulomatis]|uniref:glycosyltransferase n=1 Tax=Mannheimia granulomatis TaxID=85402 RepID=UPI00159D1F12|nr:glycosyltransferase [Mannheimia granulomatis]QLB14462.1 glycosyltransferase [Mannheimia granulomatis]